VTHSQRIAPSVIDTIEDTRRLMDAGQTLVVEPSHEVERALWGLREFMFETIYRGPVCQEERNRAMFIVSNLYDYYMKNPGKMSPLYLQIAEAEGLERAVLDYISGMSDAYCINLFKDIYIPQSMVPDTRGVFGY
jgi:dGTPase